MSANVLSRFPHTAVVDMRLQDILTKRLSVLREGVSEFTFANIFLFRRKYNYQISELEDGSLLVIDARENLALFPEGIPPLRQFRQVCGAVRGIRSIAEQQLARGRDVIEALNGLIVADRDNYDYIYRCSDLATLQGRHYHKKRNHVNAFLRSYRPRSVLLDSKNYEDALQILERWHHLHQQESDYQETLEALENMDALRLRGHIVYDDDNNSPIAFALGEFIAGGAQFVIHYEKALVEYRGIYQFLNMDFAATLCGCCEFINMEQDLGNSGLRQSKMTYRPAGFIRKYRVLFPEKKGNAAERR